MNRSLRFLGVLLALLLLATTALAAEPLRLELEATAANLPEGDIRVAIEKELGRPVTGRDPTLPSDVTLGIAEGKLVIRVKQGNSVAERSVPLPANLADVPLTVSLIVGNLARDQSVGLAAPEATSPVAPAPAAAPTTAPSSAAAPAPFLVGPSAAERRELYREPPEPPPVYRSNWFGVHVAQDLAIVGGNNVCDVSVGEQSANYACFYEGTTDKPFVHTPYPFRDGIQQGLVVATQRLLVSYDHAFSPFFTLGGRAGYAFGGGPPAGQEVKKVNGAVPDRATGTGGSSFLPYHLELKGAAWFLPLTNQRFRANVQVAVGTAQVDAKTTVAEYDCTHAGSPDKDPSQTNSQSQSWTDPKTGQTLTPFEQCKQGKGIYNHSLYKPVSVDAWRKMGQVFFSLGAGSMLAVTDQLGVVLNLNVMYMLPASGVVIEPSLGVEIGL